MPSRRELPCPVIAQALRTGGQEGACGWNAGPLRVDRRPAPGLGISSRGADGTLAPPWPPALPCQLCAPDPSPQHTRSRGRLSSDRKRPVCLAFTWRAAVTSGVRGGTLERGTGESCDWGLESKSGPRRCTPLPSHLLSMDASRPPGALSRHSHLDCRELLPGFISEEATASCPRLSGQRPQRKVPLCQPFRTA